MLLADLHIHTVLSPCGDIEMTPLAIVKRSKTAGIRIIGITDHNSTRQCAEVRRIGEREGVFVLCGAEVNTREEAHVLVFVDGQEALEELQRFLDESLSDVRNEPDIFGHQLVVDEAENVIYEEERLLINALDKSIEEIADFIRSLGGIFIPAHIDKPMNSIISQLGFIPSHLTFDALELSPKCEREAFISAYPYLRNRTFISSSDAHYLDDIGRATTLLDIDEFSFSAVKDAISKLSCYE